MKDTILLSMEMEDRNNKVITIAKLRSFKSNFTFWAKLDEEDQPVSPIFTDKCRLERFLLNTSRI